MKKLYDKFPILVGLILGMGISICFILFEYFLVTTGISECGVIVDSYLRIITGILTLILLKEIYKNKFGKLFTTRPPKSTWLYCIPMFLYLLLQFLHLPTAESLTTAYISGFYNRVYSSFFSGIISFILSVYNSKKCKIYRL